MPLARGKDSGRITDPEKDHAYIGKGAKRTIRFQISLRLFFPIRRALVKLAEDAMIGRTVASLGAECDC